MSVDTVNIWLGEFDSQARFTSFMEESYSDDDDDAPISQFAASQGETFYDHDWLESYYSEKGQKDLLRHVPSVYLHGVEAKMGEIGLKNANALILFYNQWSSPVDKVESPELWHLGQFDEAFLKNTRNEYTADSIPDEFWTSLPNTAKDIKALEKLAKNDPSSMVKLGIMARCGIGVEQDYQQSNSLFSKANSSPVMLKEGFLAVANQGYAEAWYGLYGLCCKEAKELSSEDERREYIEKAVELGSDDAKCGLASMLMYGLSELYDKDYARAEQLLLSVSDFNTSGKLHQFYCLYLMKDDYENAFIWKKRDVDTYGSKTSAQKISNAYFQGKGVEVDLVKAAQYLYLYLCQKDESALKGNNLELLQRLSDDELVAGRLLAKEWIEETGVAVAAARGRLAHFSGENYDPFEFYRKEIS